MDFEPLVRARGGREDGVALVVAIVAMLLMSALGVALVLNTSSEILIAGNFRNAQEAFYAADAALELAMGELAIAEDWNGLLDGSVRSSFVDGAPGGTRPLADGSVLDLGQVLSMANCQKATACTAADLVANTATRRWGSNNPVWRLYAHGPVSRLLPPGAVNSWCYVAVLVADDPSENDDDPSHDGTGPTNPGAGVLGLRAEAFGPRGAHKVVEATVAHGGAGLRVLSWREIR